MKRFKKYALRAAGTDDNITPIHRFRVALKKLRALLHLINSTQSKEVRFSAPLKKINTLAGAIRDQQLYYQAIAPFCRKKKDLLFETVRQTDRKTKKLNKEIKHFHFQKSAKSILRKVPRSIQKGKLGKFIHQRSGLIAERLSRAVVSDKALHAVRKDLKDILYNLKHFQGNVLQYFPIAGTTTIRELKDLTNILNAHQDYTVWLSLLDAGLSDKMTQQNIPVLKSVRRKWEQKKNGLKTVYPQSNPLKCHLFALGREHRRMLSCIRLYTKPGYRSYCERQNVDACSETRATLISYK